jgi:hypothetical protein
MEGVASGPAGQPLGAERARQIIAQLVRGDIEVLRGLYNRPLSKTFGDKLTLENSDGDWLVDDDPLTQEWGLAQEASGEVHVVSGMGKSVAWAPYLSAGATALAHSHPFGPRRSIQKDAGFTFRELTNSAVGGKEAAYARLMAFPTVGDVVFAAEQGIDRHTVYTPYVFDFTASRVLDPTQKPSGPRIEFEIFDARYVDSSQQHVEARMDARANTRLIWTSLVRAPADAPRTVAFTFRDNSAE